jgi:signal transduction histidine kinase
VAPVLAGGQYFGSVSILRDVTREVEVDRMKSEFVSTVSHELRTPMTSIKGYAELMQMGASGLLSEPQAHYVRVIKQNADRMSQLVNDLLDISRIESGRIQLDIRPLDMAHAIHQVVDGHLAGRMQHEGKPLRVTVDVSPALPLVLGDHARIVQVLTNLLDNAHNYTPAGGWIGVRAYVLGSSVFVDVADSGIGIDKEIHEKIFERFYRAEEAAVQETAGTGLGLAIVRNLVEMHGGKISVRSETGRGSTFTFNLPAAAADGVSGDHRQTERQARPS